MDPVELERPDFADMDSEEMEASIRSILHPKIRRILEDLGEKKITDTISDMLLEQEEFPALMGLTSNDELLREKVSDALEFLGRRNKEGKHSELKSQDKAKSGGGGSGKQKKIEEIEIMIENINNLELEESSFAIRVNPYAAVFSVKGKIHDSHGVPTAKQTLIFNENELHDEQILGLVGVRKGSVLRLWVDLDAEAIARASKREQRWRSWLRSEEVWIKHLTESCVSANQASKARAKAKKEKEKEKEKLKAKKDKGKSEAVDVDMDEDGIHPKFRDIPSALIGTERRSDEGDFRTQLLTTVIPNLSAELTDLVAGPCNVYGNKFTEELRRRFSLLRTTLEGLELADRRFQRTRALIERASRMKLELSKPPPMHVKMAIATCVEGFLLLVDKHSDRSPAVVEQVLGLFRRLVKNAPFLSLANGKTFGPEITRSISPMIAFVRSCVSANNGDSKEITKPTLDVVLKDLDLLQHLDAIKKSELNTFDRLMRVADQPAFLVEVIPSLWDRVRLCERLVELRVPTRRAANDRDGAPRRTLALQLLFDWALARGTVSGLLVVANSMLELSTQQGGETILQAITGQMQTLLGHQPCRAPPPGALAAIDEPKASQKKKEDQPREFRVGDRVEANYKGKWYAGDLLTLPHNDKYGRYEVFCDVDKETEKKPKTLVKQIRHLGEPPKEEQPAGEDKPPVQGKEWLINFAVDDELDCLDTQKKWFPATVIAAEDDRVKIHYNDFEAQWDEWIDKTSERLAPRGAMTTSTIEPGAEHDIRTTDGLWVRAVASKRVANMMRFRIGEGEEEEAEEDESTQIEVHLAEQHRIKPVGKFSDFSGKSKFNVSQKVWVRDWKNARRNQVPVWVEGVVKEVEEESGHVRVEIDDAGAKFDYWYHESSADEIVHKATVVRSQRKWQWEDIEESEEVRSWLPPGYGRNRGSITKSEEAKKAERDEERLLAAQHVRLTQAFISSGKSDAKSDEKKKAVPTQSVKKACSLIVSQIRLLSKHLGPDSQTASVQPYLPLQLHVHASTFEELASILHWAKSELTSRKRWSNEFVEAMYMLANALHVLKVHIHQFVELKVNRQQCGLTDALVQGIYKVLLSVISEPFEGSKLPRHKSLAQAVQKVTASMMTSDFFFPSSFDMVKSLTDLTNERNRAMERDMKGWTTYKETVYSQLLCKISRSDTGASLVMMGTQPKKDKGKGSRTPRHGAVSAQSEEEAGFLALSCALLSASAAEDRKHRAAIAANAIPSAPYRPGPSPESKALLSGALASIQWCLLSQVFGRLREHAAKLSLEAAEVALKEKEEREQNSGGSATTGARGRSDDEGSDSFTSATRRLDDSTEKLLSRLLHYSMNVLRQAKDLCLELRKTALTDARTDPRMGSGAADTAQHILNNSVVGNLCAVLCPFLCFLLDLDFDSCGVEVCMVTNKDGLSIRGASDSESIKVAQVLKNSLVTILQKTGENALIRYPVSGWITVSRSGLENVFDATESPLNGHSVIPPKLKTEFVLHVIPQALQFMQSMESLTVALKALDSHRPLAWVSTLSHTSAWMIGRMCSVLAVGSPPGKEEAEARSSGIIQKGTCWNLFSEGLLLDKIQDSFHAEISTLLDGVSRSFNEGNDARSQGNELEFEDPFCLPPISSDRSKQETAFLSDLMAPDGPKGMAKVFLDIIRKGRKMKKSTSLTLKGGKKEDYETYLRVVFGVMLWRLGRVRQARHIAETESEANVADEKEEKEIKEGKDGELPQLELKRQNSLTSKSTGLSRIWNAAHSAWLKISKNPQERLPPFLERARLLMHTRPIHPRAKVDRHFDRDAAGEDGGLSELEKPVLRRAMSEIRKLMRIQRAEHKHTTEDIIITAIMKFLRDDVEKGAAARPAAKDHRRVIRVLLERLNCPLGPKQPKIEYDGSCALLAEGIPLQHQRAVAMLIGLKVFRVAVSMLKRPSMIIQVLHHHNDLAKLVASDSLSNPASPNDEDGQSSDSIPQMGSNQLTANLFAASEHLKEHITTEYFKIIRCVTLRRCPKCARRFLSPDVGSEKGAAADAKEFNETEVVSLTCTQCSVDFKRREMKRQRSERKVHIGMDEEKLKAMESKHGHGDLKQHQLGDSKLKEPLTKQQSEGEGDSKETAMAALHTDTKKKDELAAAARAEAKKKLQPFWTLKLYMIHACSLNLRHANMDHLWGTKIIESLSPLLTLPTGLSTGHKTADALAASEIPWNLRYAGWILLQLLAYSASVSSDQTPAESNTTSLAMTLATLSEDGISPPGSAVKALKGTMLGNRTISGFTLSRTNSTSGEEFEELQNAIFNLVFRNMQNLANVRAAIVGEESTPAFTSESWSSRWKALELRNGDRAWLMHSLKDCGFFGSVASREISISTAELDLYMIQFLSLLLRCAKSYPIKQLMLSRPWLTMLSTLVRGDPEPEPKTSKVALQLLRLILPLLKPTDEALTALKWGVGGDQKLGAEAPGRAIITTLLKAIGGAAKEWYEVETTQKEQPKKTEEVKEEKLPQQNWAEPGDLVVDNLPENYTEEKLSASFCVFGDVDDAQVPIPGRGFVSYTNKLDAIEAQKAMDGSDCEGRALSVMLATEVVKQGGSSKTSPLVPVAGDEKNAEAFDLMRSVVVEYIALCRELVGLHHWSGLVCDELLGALKGLQKLREFETASGLHENIKPVLAALSVLGSHIESVADTPDVLEKDSEKSSKEKDKEKSKKEKPKKEKDKEKDKAKDKRKKEPENKPLALPTGELRVSSAQLFEPNAPEQLAIMEIIIDFLKTSTADVGKTAAEERLTRSLLFTQLRRRCVCVVYNVLRSPWAAQKFVEKGYAPILCDLAFPALPEKLPAAGTKAGNASGGTVPAPNTNTVVLGERILFLEQRLSGLVNYVKASPETSNNSDESAPKFKYTVPPDAAFFVGGKTDELYTKAPEGADKNAERTVLNKMVRNYLLGSPMAYQRAENAKADKFPAPASASDNKAEQDQTQDPPVNVTVKPKLSADAKGAILLKKPESQICCTIDSAKKGLTLHFRFNIEAQALQEEKSRGEAKPEAPSNESDKPDEPADDNAEGSGEAGAGEEAENEAAEQPRPGLPMCPEIATCTDRSEAHQVFYRHNEPEGGSNAKEEGKQEAEKSEGFATAARVAGGSGSLQDTTKVSGSASQGDTKRKKSDKQIFSFTCGSTEICLRAFPMSGDALEIGCSLNVSDAGGEEEPKSVESLLAAVDLGNKVEDFIANGWDVVDDLIMCAKSNDGTAWDEFWKNGLPLDSDESKRLRTYCQRLGKREAVGEVTVPNGSNGDWTSVAIRLNSASSSEDSMEVFINGNRCYPFPHANVSMETKGDPQCKLVFPGEVDMKLRELFVWERSLMLPQIKDLTKSSALSYLTAHTELADALIKRGEVVADLPFLPSRLPSTISLLGPVSTTKTADVLEANSEKFKSFEVPEGSALELKDKRLEFGPSKDYTLDLDFVVNYSKVKLGAGRFIPLVQFDAQGAKIMLDTASRSLAIICKVRHRTSSGLTNAEVRDHSWYRLRVYSSPKAVKVHLNAKPVLTLDWPLSPGMKVFRVISGSKGNSRPRMWEIGTLLSCRRKQGEEWSLNVKWFKERNKKKGEVIWPAGDVVVIDDSKTSGEEPKNGMNVMARLEGHDGYKWAQGVISNAEPMGSKMHWTLDLTIPINLRPLTVGDKVQAQYHGGKYYNGQIAAVNGDGTYNVDFDDGDKEEGLRPDQIKRKGDSMPMRKRPYKVNIKPGESRSVYLLPADSTSSIANVPNVQGEPQGEEEGMSEDEGGFGFGEGGGRFGGGRPAINMEMLTFAREANPEVFNTLQGMGFPELHCCRAIVEGQGSVQRAVDWAIGNQPQDDYLFFGSGGEGPPKDKNKSSDDNPSAGGDSAGAAASTGGEEEKANTEAGEDGGSGELENDVRRVLLTLDDPDMKSSKKEPFEIETNVEMELFLNHDFTLTGPLVLFGASSSLATLRKADTAAALAASAVSSAGSGASFCVKWLRIGLGKKGASKVSAPLDAKDNTWQWLPTGLPATMENQLIELLSRTERAEGFEPEVVHQALIHSSFDLATAWQMLQERDSLETIKSEIAMSKATKKQAMLQALGYPTKESRDALMESKYDTQTAVLRLLGQSMPDTAEKEVAGWDIPKDFVSPNELKPLSIKPMDAAARDGLSAAGKFGTPTPELWTSVTNKDWDRHHDDLETLKTLPLSKVKLALLHTESALTTHYGVVCALKAMQVADKEKVKDNALRIFDDDEPLGADAKASRRPPQQPFYIRLLRLVHLSENAIHMSIFRSVIASVLDSQIRSLEQRAKSVEEKTAPLSLVRSTVAVASEMSSESILHSLGYYSAQGRGDSKLMANAGKPGAMINDEGVRVKLGTKGTGIGQYYCGRKLGRTAIPGSNGTCGPADGPQCESCLRYQLEQGPTDGSFIGARAMVQFEERDRYLLRVVVGAEETSDGKWTLSVHSKNSTSLVNYTYPDGSNRILILPMPPIPVPTVGMRLVGRHGSWYPGQITHCEAKADGRFSVKLRYDDGDTSKLDYPIPAHAVVRRSVRNPIILLGDEWGRKTCKKPPSKSKSRASIGEQITPNAEKAKDAVSNPSIDLAFWITDLLLDVSDTYPDLARHLHPYLFPNSFQRIIFKVVRGGGSQDEEMTRVKLINTLAKIIRRFGLSFLREKNIEELANAMQTLFVAHSDNSENLKPVLEVTVKKTPFGATFDNNSCIVSSVTPNTDAAKAGLKKGYRLCRINGNEVFNYNQEEELRNTPLPFTIIFKADPLRNLEASPLLMACVELNLSIAVRREGKSMPQACKNEWFEGLVAAANVLDIIQPLTLGSAQSLRLLPDPVATIWSREVMRTWPGIEPVMRMMNPMSDGRNKFEVVLKEISEAKDIKDVKAQYDSLSWLIECEADDAQESAARVMTLLCSTLERRNLKNSDKVFIAEQLMSLARNQPHCANWISTNIDMITPAVVFLDQQAKDSKKDTWTVGMVVRATYKRGTQVYKGIIRRVNGDGTYSIKYDDGDIWDDAPASAIQSRPVNTPNKYQVMHEEFKNLIESILERAEEGKAKLPSNAGDADKGALGSLQPVFLKSCKMVDRAYKSDGKLRGKRLFHIMHGIYELIPGSDAELVKLANAYCRKRSLEINSLNPTNFNPTKEELLYFKKLEPIRSFNITLLQIRLFMLRQINAMVMPYGTAVVDLSRTQVAGSLAQKFHKIRDLIFWNHKHKFIQKVLMATKGDSSDHPALRLRLDKMRANRKKNSVDMMGRYTLFGQAFRQLRHSDCFLLKPLSHHKAFKVEFIGMHAIDAGGPYRQAITELCHEIQSFKLPLFIPTRNNLNKIGSGRDHWIPNPASTKPTQLRMFEFVGKLMGMAFRVEHYLELDLPAIFWKHLVESEPSLMDLKLIDLNQYKLLKKLDSKRLAPGLDFTVVGSDGRVVELVPDGASKKVSASNYDEFMKLAKDARLNEFKIQCAAIRRGLTAVVPMSALSLLTHEELETSICGVHEIDVDLLERNTAYGGCKESDPHIRLFWRMMREAFSNEDRIHLLQFAWARSRLPTGDNWRERFHIEMTKGGDNAFPTAHTCFFMLQLPAYTNYETMCQKVKYAITHCTAIDGDHSYNAASHIELEEMEGDDDE